MHTHVGTLLVCAVLATGCSRGTLYAAPLDGETGTDGDGENAADAPDDGGSLDDGGGSQDDGGGSQDDGGGSQDDGGGSLDDDGGSQDDGGGSQDDGGSSQDDGGGSQDDGGGSQDDGGSSQDDDGADSGATLPHPLFGVTLDSVSNLSETKISLQNLGRKPTARIVFDAPEPAANYAAAAESLHEVAFIMGQVLDSYYLQTQAGTYCGSDLSAVEARWLDYLDHQVLAANVDIWELGNEVNGEWLCGGNPVKVYRTIKRAYELVKARDQRAALTLFYYTPQCADDAGGQQYEMFAWIDANVEAELRQGIDYVLVSYYETACPTHDPWDEVFTKLAQRFPNSFVGFGETGTEDENAPLADKKTILNRYYSLVPPIEPQKYIGGYFWWYFSEDMVPMTLPLWAELDKYSTLWNTLYP